MPQLWLTFQEFAERFDCDETHVRQLARTSNWKHKRSGDGRTRVQLPRNLMTIYFERFLHAANVGNEASLTGNLTRFNMLMPWDSPVTLIELIKDKN